MYVIFWQKQPEKTFVSMGYYSLYPYSRAARNLFASSQQTDDSFCLIFGITICKAERIQMLITEVSASIISGIEDCLVVRPSL